MATTSSDPATRPSLLVRLGNPRDREAWDMFVQVYAPLVYGCCQRCGLRPQDAEDVTQEVFLSIHKVINKFSYDRGRGQFRNWLATVTHNACCQFLRKEHRQPHGLGCDGEQDGLAQVPALDVDPIWDTEYHARILRLALDRTRPHVTPESWAAFTGTWLEERPVAEVARELGLTAARVYLARCRVLARLRKEVEEIGEDIPGLFPPHQA